MSPHATAHLEVPRPTQPDLNDAVMVPSHLDSALMPDVDPLFVPFGIYDDLYAVLASRMFYPVWINGLSGIGKTYQTRQAAAALGREIIRVNFEQRTDEDGLIGNWRLHGGDTKFELGPVPVAMRRGAILLLDEIDLGGADIMCLQPVLEGEPLYIKKINQVVRPAPGFTIVATGNTLGRGDDTGKFQFTNIMNEAMLERFPVTLEQVFPPLEIEREILMRQATAADIPHPEAMIERMLRFADMSRSLYSDGHDSEVISTRRLIHIMRAYAIFHDEMRAVSLAVARFPVEARQAFVKQYETLLPTPDDNVAYDPDSAFDSMQPDFVTGD